MELVVSREPEAGPAEFGLARSDGEGGSAVHDRARQLQQHGPGGLLPRLGLSEVRTPDQTRPKQTQTGHYWTLLDLTGPNQNLLYISLY